MQNQRFAVVDIETSGGDPKRERITEIAIYLLEGGKIVEEFSTLLNPEKSIPSYISKLTGITNEMVRNAPKFYEEGVAIRKAMKFEDVDFNADGKSSFTLAEVIKNIGRLS